MRSRSTIEFLGLWERLGNPNFKPLEFKRFRNEAGSNYFVLSPQRWIEATRPLASPRNQAGMAAHTPTGILPLSLPQVERLKRLNQIAIRQMQVLTSSNLKALPGAKGK